MNAATMKRRIIEMVNKIDDTPRLKKIYTFVLCWFIKE